MKRVYRSETHDVWEFGNKFVITDTNKRPSNKYPNIEHDSLEGCVKLCLIFDKTDWNDPMSIFDHFDVEAVE
jgi:hypothetical protein